MATVVALPAEAPSRLPRRVTLGLGATLGAVACAATTWVVASSTVLVQPLGAGILRGLYVGTAVAVGVYTWWRRPQSQLGPLVAGIGFLYALTSLNAAEENALFTLGMMTLALWIVYVAYVYLAFPRARLTSARERRFMQAYALATVVLWTLVLVFAEKLPGGGPFAKCAGDCPVNAFQLVETDAAVSNALAIASTAIIAIGLLGVAGLILAKTRSAVHLRRRAIEPLAYVFILTIVTFVAGLLIVSAYPGARQTFRVLDVTLAVAGPVAILVGQIRGSMFATRSLGRFVATSGAEPVAPTRAQGFLREALGDPTLQLALWSPERGAYVDVDGAGIELPLDDPDREVTPVAREGRPLAALIHQPTLEESPELLEGLTATSLMLVDNTRLIEDLRASRARIVSAAEQERLRLERDLHDGAQQRLMAIQIKLSLARDDVDSAVLGAQLEEIAADAASAVEELRLLAHGIYPTVLRERGLAAALRAFASTFPRDVTVVDQDVGRARAEVEAAVYFCALEAVQNAVKHAGTGARVTVTVGRSPTQIRCDVVDDGAGFDPRGAAAGVGLVSMRDRIGAVGGELDVVSRSGDGTRVQMLVPVGASVP